MNDFINDLSLLDLINKHIKLYESKQKEISELLSKLHSLQYELNSPVHRFKCPLGLSDPICPECENAKPSHVRDDIYQFPLEIQKEYNNIIDYKTRKCDVWKLKEDHGVCGCGGKLECECGYFSKFCMTPQETICPFCGRQCKTIKYDTIYNLVDIQLSSQVSLE